ncbi:gamma-glutamylcyclotransferase [Acidovorax sp. A1169]|uniref:gamma-glutamylcyclotransferase family protein n=1 Tax=Acidovorax sp. A1169 TaxID=3059524 RepID=UPI002737B1D5|nr:gamma-glutamylcyclotransferase family protein [Acidovorax sp. A1169]MDP4074561.1 gamma-glutamylcyclotransferase family protein [Acidovorax sp. A1169]
MPDASHLPGPLRCVFVYGTLRKGGSNDITRLLPAPRFVGMARLAGTLYHLGAYPGLLLGGAVDVVGEVYAIEPALEQRLDGIEEIHGRPDDEYFKRELTLPVAGLLVDCLVYEINPDRVTAAARIEGGDWMLELSRPVRK